jgi:serine/threonine protein phosphatase 1
MEKERVFIIADLHGCLDMLKRLMEKIDWQPEEDRLIFLGDYIDRGPDSRGVVDFILSLLRCSPGVQCLIGNHEALLLDYLSGKDRRLFLLNGGTTTLESYERGRKEGEELIPADHVAFYRSLVPYVELERHYAVHAGFKPGVPLEAQTLEDMTWIREPFIHSENYFEKRIIFGHTPFYEPLIMKNKIGLDTGAVYGNRLTCLELPEMRFHFVGAQS